MNKSERVQDWCRFYKQSPLKYEMNALLSVLQSDGEEMLSAVLKELGLTQSLALVKDARGKNSKVITKDASTKE